MDRRRRGRLGHIWLCHLRLSRHSRRYLEAGDFTLNQRTGIEPTGTQRPPDAKIGSRRRPVVEPLNDAERERLEGQTRRNLDALEHESEGRLDLAIELYEQNVAECFVGDWPYSRLAGIYERAKRYEDAIRVLTRALEVTRADRRRPAGDRRAVVQGLQGRLRTLKKTVQETRRAGKGTPGGRSFIPLPVLD